MLLAQVNDFGDFLDKFESGELIGVIAIASVFSTFLIVAVVFAVTRAIANVRIASINARMVQTLASHGHSADEIERIVKSTARGIRINLPNRWQKAQPAEFANAKSPPKMPQNGRPVGT